MYPINLNRKFYSKETMAVVAVGHLLDLELSGLSNEFQFKNRLIRVCYSSNETLNLTDFKFDYVVLVVGNYYAGWLHRETAKKHADNQGGKYVLERSQMADMSNFPILFGVVKELITETPIIESRKDTRTLNLF